MNSNPVLNSLGDGNMFSKVNRYSGYNNVFEMILEQLAMMRNFVEKKMHIKWFI